MGTFCGSISIAQGEQGGVGWQKVEHGVEDKAHQGTLPEPWRCSLTEAEPKLSQVPDLSAYAKVLGGPLF